MTSKREDREALIEAAKVAIQKRAQWRSLHWPKLDALAHDDVARALAEAALAVFEQAHTPTDDERTPEFESLEQELFKHQPVLSMRDGHIAGCQCMDRVFQERTEDWGTHLAEVFTALRRPVQGEPTDIAVDDALAAFEGYPGNMIDRSSRSWQRDQMRAALRAAAAVTEQGGENR